MQNAKTPQNGIRAVIFDFGDVYNLSNGPGTVFMRQFGRAEREEKRKLWNAEVKPLWRRLTKGEITTEEFWASAGLACGVAVDPAEMNREMVHGQVSERFRNRGLVEMIIQLKKRGITTAMLTNNVKGWFDEWKMKDENRELFDPIIASQEIGMRKPDEEIYLHTFSVLGLQPQECFFIDDQADNVEAGIRLGMPGFVFPPKTNVEHANWALKRKLKELELLGRG